MQGGVPLASAEIFSGLAASWSRSEAGSSTMRVKVFTLLWRDGEGFDDVLVDEFLSDKVAIDVIEHFFVHEKTPVLVLVVTYRGAAATRRALGERRARDAEPSAGLSAEELRRYEAIRDWRNQLASQVGRPPYAVFTNRQAVEIARRAPTTRSQLGEIQGIGAAKIKEFGDSLLALLVAMAQVAQEVQPKATEGSDG
ncbi:MAG: hypothetical protein AUK47_03020 [Deltaproteobacteria bacterium CG2_30_63_29]|nr:MAG: hypothetical protein AUK47_03020 [Deltaproteobacteria bacterium CG2_30_63_29]